MQGPPDTPEVRHRDEHLPRLARNHLQHPRYRIRIPSGGMVSTYGIVGTGTGTYVLNRKIQNLSSVSFFINRGR